MIGSSNRVSCWWSIHLECISDPIRLCTTGKNVNWQCLFRQIVVNWQCSICPWNLGQSQLWPPPLNSSYSVSCWWSIHVASHSMSNKLINTVLSHTTAYLPVWTLHPCWASSRGRPLMHDAHTGGGTSCPHHLGSQGWPRLATVCLHK